jgi:Bacterial self-protective colicin-like immunity
MSADTDAATRMADRYKQLISRFVDGEISASEFEGCYLALFKSDTSKVGGEKFNILDKLFADVDAFEADPELRKQVYDGIGAEELLSCARAAYKELYEA